MAAPHFEVPFGLIDGVNRIFVVSHAYRSGSTAVFLNGLLMRADYVDGWEESDPEMGEVTLREPPRGRDTGDVVQVFYLDTIDDSPEARVVCRLVARLRDVESVQGSFRVSSPLFASVGSVGSLEGRLAPLVGVQGRWGEVETLAGRIVAACG